MDALDTFDAAVLAGVGGPQSASAICILRTWARFEDGASLSGGGAIARYNPLNTTQWEPGSWTVNSVGVKGYPDFATGVRATVTTLTNGYYPQIVANLRADAPLSAWRSAAVLHELDIWGTGEWPNRVDIGSCGSPSPPPPPPSPCPIGWSLGSDGLCHPPPPPPPGPGPTPPSPSGSSIGLAALLVTGAVLAGGWWWERGHPGSLEHLGTRVAGEAHAPQVFARGGAVGDHRAWLEELRERYPAVRLDVAERPGYLSVDRIVVPASERGQGVGSAIMRDITERADELGKPVGLPPDSAFGGNKGRLVGFYRRFGFVPNRGRYADYAVSGSMVRQPH